MRTLNKGTFANNLKFLRNAENLTQSDMLKKLGIKKSTWASYESLKSPNFPSVEVLSNICNLFRVDEATLLRAKIDNLEDLAIIKKNYELLFPTLESKSQIDPEGNTQNNTALNETLHGSEKGRISKFEYLYTIPSFVLKYLVNRNRLLQPKVLLLSGVYSRKYNRSYFYRTLPNNPDGSLEYNPMIFQTFLLDGLLIPDKNPEGRELNEFERINMFLDQGYLLANALDKDGSVNIDDLSTFIKVLNPERIMFLIKEKNNDTVNELIRSDNSGYFESKILVNPCDNTHVFTDPYDIKREKIFSKEMELLRQKMKI